MPLTDVSAFIYRKVYFSNKTIFRQPIFLISQETELFLLCRENATNKVTNS